MPILTPNSFYVGQLDYIEKLNLLATEMNAVYDTLVSYRDQAAASQTAAASSASSASASQTAAASSASSASASQTAAASSASSAAASQTATASSASSAAASQTAAASSASSASTSASNAALSQTAAASSASSAAASQTAAASSASSASASQTAAASSASSASASQTAAAFSASSASASSTLSYNWAEASPGVEVSPGQYSAKHWAYYGNNIKYKGLWSSTSYPSTPSIGDKYTFSANTTISGTDYVIGDSIVWNGTTWDRHPATPVVTGSDSGKVLSNNGTVVTWVSSISLDSVTVNAPTVGGHATNKTYVDGQISSVTSALAGKASTGANTFIGTQNLNNNSLTGIKTATFQAQTSITATSGAVSIDWSANSLYVQTEPTGIITYSFTNPSQPCRLQLVITSDGTSSAYVHVFPASVKWIGITWQQVANKTAIITFYWDGTTYWAVGGNEV